MMNMQINQLVKTLLQKDSLEQCSLQELEQFADRHPYFGAAQLLLTKKLQTENSDRYDEQLQKTFLFFHNPLWVEHLLNETGNAEIIAPEKKEEEEHPSAAVELTPEPHVIEQTEVPVTPSFETNENKEDTPITEIKQELVVEATPPETDPIAIGFVAEPELISPVVEQIEIPVIPPVESKEEEEIKIITETKQDLAVEANRETDPIAHGLSSQAVSPPIDSPILKDELPGNQPSAIRQGQENPAKEELIFEPYHTVDYFASQGIKFKEEEKPADNFGKQLKSFTDWLKTMKRLPVSEIAKQVEIKSGGKVQQVEQLAAHSLQDREILTETMAEVWEKQGNVAKAIEIYSKLSLLDPSKSRYFAAKIEELKKIN